MKSRSILTLAALAVGLALCTSGCASLRKPTVTRRPAPAAAPQRPPTYALAVTVVGEQQPTAEQWAALRTKFAEVLAARGLVLVNDIGQADEVIIVQLDPGVGEAKFGTATVTGILPNLLGYAATLQSPVVYPMSYGYVSPFGMSPWPGYTAYNSTILGYTDPYGYWDSSGSSYGSGYTVTPGTPSDRPPRVRPDHPTRGDPSEHPPGTGDRPPQRVVGDHPRPTTPPSDEKRHWWSRRDDSQPTRPFQPRSEPTYARSEPTSSASSSSSSSSSSNYSSSSSSSSSYSAPSYSPPAESSSSSSSSSPPSYSESSPARSAQEN